MLWRIAVVIPRQIPQEAGCLSILMAVIPGAPIDAIGDVPAALSGTKWPDVRSWRVFLWFNGKVFTCDGLKTETPEPWKLQSLLEHRYLHHEHWRLVRPALKS